MREPVTVEGLLADLQYVGLFALSVVLVWSIVRSIRVIRRNRR